MMRSLSYHIRTLASVLGSEKTVLVSFEKIRNYPSGERNKKKDKLHFVVLELDIGVSLCNKEGVELWQ
ncbi:hypothetical protein ABKV19_000653 [Rosa sericea]